MNRRSGLSAMLRLKNEQEFIQPCIESIIDWFDEVVVCMQGSSDNTEQIIRDFNSPKVSIYHYPHDSWPNGDGYGKQDPNHPMSRTYFYNWCMERTTRTHVCKWDGDMVALDWLGDEVHDRMRHNPETIWFKGVDIVGKELTHIGERIYCADEPRIFEVTPRTKYVNGSKCERLQTSGGSEYHIEMAAYLHFKWAKPLSSATQAWPDNWHESAHFQNIIKRAQPVKRYNGEYPRAIRDRMS